MMPPSNSSDSNSTQVPGVILHYSSEPFPLFIVLVMVGVFCVVAAIAGTLRYCPAPTRQNRRRETAFAAALRRERERKRLEYVHAVVKTRPWHGGARSIRHCEPPLSVSTGDDEMTLKIPRGDSDDGRNVPANPVTHPSEHCPKGGASHLASDAAHVDVDSSPDVDAETNLRLSSVPTTNGDDSAECSICLDPFAESDRVCESNNANCRHLFHLECLVPWLLRHEHCPVCREAYLPPSGANQPSTTLVKR
jgi:Ring finger domain